MGLFKKKIDGLTYFEYILNFKGNELMEKTLALNKAIDLLAKALSMCTLEVYSKGTETKDALFYKLNIMPNDNEYGTNFWYNVWNKFFNEEEVLIIEINKKLFLVDDFREDDTILYEKTYSDIRLKSDNGYSLKINKDFKSSEVIHLKLDNEKIKTLLSDYYCKFGELINIATNYYANNNLSRWILGYPGGQQPLKDAVTKRDISYEEYKTKITQSLFENKDSVVMLSKHFDLNKVENKNKIVSDDILNLKQSWGESVADSFLIPRDIFFGKYENKDSINSFYTYCLKPYLEMLEDALNSRVLKKNEYLNGRKIKANLNSIKFYDIVENANSLDKLYSDGFSHNDIRKFTNQEQIDEPWANEHRITKNYSEDVSNNGSN